MEGRVVKRRWGEMRGERKVVGWEVLVWGRRMRIEGLRVEGKLR